MILQGNPVSKGVAIGKVLVYRPFSAVVREAVCSPEEVYHQLAEYRRAKAASEAELEALCQRIEKNDPDRAKIFISHRDILNDVSLEEEIEKNIMHHHFKGSWAIQQVYDEFILLLSDLEDLIMRERAADLKDVQNRLLRNWYGAANTNLLQLPGPVIVAAHDLLPSDTATLDRENVLAILTEVGGATSHSAIIARSYGIPAVLGITGLLSSLSQEILVAMDAESGKVILNPDAPTVARFEQRRAEWLRQRQEDLHFLRAEPLTADGVRLEIGLNIENVNREEQAAAAFTDFVGLFRTEFLYMGKAFLPVEEHQYHCYKNMLASYAPKPVTLRTMDIGGDKTVECLGLPKENNPFLGNRALRLCFSRPELFRTQLRAALRASVHGQLWLMLPMVASIEDIRKAKDIIAKVDKQLRSEGFAVANDYKVGVMIEIPSLALIANLVIREVDFASIGTNDLCQYLTATDRQNPEVASYYECCHPAVLRTIAYVAEQFNKAGKHLSVCGEMGGDAEVTEMLVGLGLRKLSMGLSAVAGVKRRLAEITIPAAETLAKKAQHLATAKEVKALMMNYTNDRV